MNFKILYRQCAPPQIFLPSAVNVHNNEWETDYRPVHVLLSRFYLDFILIYPCLIKIKSGLNLGKIWIYVSFMSYSTRVELRNFWLGISYRGDPNRKQSILAPKSWQVIFTMIFYQNSNAVCSKVNKVQRQFLSSTCVEYDMKDTKMGI